MQIFSHNPTSVSAMDLLLKATQYTLDEEAAQMLPEYCLKGPSSSTFTSSEFLVGLASYHGVVPLLYKNLKPLLQAPSTDAAPLPCMHALYKELKGHYTYITQRNMFMTAELIRIMRLFQRENISLLAFKGPTLAYTAYGDITLRQFGDLDILIQRKDLSRTIEIMLEEGYIPDVEIPQEEAKHYYDLLTTIGFDKPSSSMRIEIHWELLSRNYAISWKSDTLWDHTQEVTINHIQIPVMRFEDHLLYLCVHGSKHLFERIEWICDIDRSIRTNSETDWHYIIDKARETGIFRMLLLGLSLAVDLYGTSVPEEISGAISNDRALAKLKKKIIEVCYSADTEGSKVDKGYFYTVLMMRERFSDRIRFLWQALFATQFNDINYIRLPKYLRSFYPFIRLYRLMKKYLLR